MNAAVGKALIRAEHRLLERFTGLQFRHNVVRLKFLADGVCVEGIAFHEGVGFFDRQNIDLEFHAIAVRVGIIHGKGGAVTHREGRQDAARFQALIDIHQIGKRIPGIGHMVDTHPVRFLGGFAVDLSQIDEGHSVMLVVIGYEGQLVGFVLKLGFEHIQIPLDHLFIAVGVVDHMGEFAGCNHPDLPWKRTPPHHSAVLAYLNAWGEKRKYFGKPRSGGTPQSKSGGGDGQSQTLLKQRPVPTLKAEWNVNKTGKVGILTTRSGEV